MAYDVSNFIAFMQRRTGMRKPDANLRMNMLITGVLLILPIKYMKTRGIYRNLLSMRYEMYSVRDGVYYHHLKKGQRNSRAAQFRQKVWA